MKAIINGITVEGTPQEIMEYERLVKAQESAKEWKPDVKAKATSGSTTGCSAIDYGGSCLCTGKCIEKYATIPIFYTKP